MAYIVDLVGYFEGSVVTLTALFGAVFATLIYAARHILGEGIAHFPFVLSLGFATGYCFFAVLLQFSSLANDNDGFTSTMHALVSSTVPLVCSSIVTWYICVLTDEVDIGVCFSVCYFSYMMWMQRTVTSRGEVGLKTVVTTCLDEVPVLSLQMMHFIPAIISPVLYLTLHHNIISVQAVQQTAWHLAVSILLPVLLMAVSAETQVRRNASHPSPVMQFRNVARPAVLRALKFISACVLLVGFHSHPLLDDIKAFANLSERVATAVFIFGIVFVLAAVDLRDYYFDQKRVSARNSSSKQRFFDADSDEVIIMTPIPVAICLVGAVVCFGVFLGLPMFVLPACVGGVLLFSEFYERRFDFKNPFHLYLSMVFVLCAGLTGCVVTLCFTQKTLWYLSYGFVTPLLASWDTSGPPVGYLSLQLFCNVLSLLVCLAILIPPVLVNSLSSPSVNIGGITSTSTSTDRSQVAVADKAQTEGEDDSSDPLADGDSLGYLPADKDNGLGEDSVSSSFVTSVVTKSTLLFPSVQNSFAVMFLVLNIGVSFAEVVVREQDWRDFSVDAETVYPISLFMCTSLALCAAAIHLYSSGICPGSLVVISTLAVQGCKLLHLFGVSSAGLSACCMFMLSFSAPFLLYGGSDSGNTARGRADADGTGIDSNRQLAGLLGIWEPKIPWWAALLSVGSAGVASFWFKTHNMMYQVLLLTSGQHSTELEEAAGCLAMYMMFLGAFILVFYRRNVVLRSICLIVAAVAALVTVDALGPFSIIEMPDGSSIPFSVSYRAASGGIPGSGNMAENLASEGIVGEMLVLSDHTSFFLVLSVALAVAALLQVFPIMSPLPRLLYVVIFSFTCGMALLGWGFPAALGQAGASTSDTSLLFATSAESVYCVGSALLATSAVFHTLSSSNSALSKIIVGVWSLIPVSFLVFCMVSYQDGGDSSVYEGICWVAIAVASGIGITVRYIDWFVELTALPTVSLSASVATPTPAATKPSSNLVKSKAAIIGNFCAHVGIVYTYLACACSTLLNRDVLIPLSFCLLFCTRKGYTVFNQQFPVAVSVVMYSSLFWVCSALYSLLLKGYEGLQAYEYLEGFSLSLGILRDENVSIWTAPSAWMTIVNLVLLCCPLFVLYSCYRSLHHRQQVGSNPRAAAKAQDSLFVFTLLCILSIVASQIWSIRLLGVVSLVAGFKYSAAGPSNLSNHRVI